MPQPPIPPRDPTRIPRVRSTLLMNLTAWRRNTPEKLLKVIVCLPEEILGTDMYYIPVYISYKQMKADLHMFFGRDFCQSATLLDPFRYQCDPGDEKYAFIQTLCDFLRNFIDSDYIMKNKVRFFKYPEYYCIFTDSPGRREYSECRQCIQKYLGHSVSGLKPWKNLIEFNDTSSFDSIIKSRNTTDKQMDQQYRRSQRTFNSRVRRGVPTDFDRDILTLFEELGKEFGGETV